MIHTCPEEICRAFYGDEATKSVERKNAMEWMAKQTIRKGDIVRMPDGADGELKEFVAEFDIVRA